jgi:hypothetical protein
MGGGMIGWGRGQEVLGGKCLECGGRMLLHWRDKIGAEWYCSGCGLVSKSKGKGTNVCWNDTRLVFGKVFRRFEDLGYKSIPLSVMVKVVDQVCVENFGDHVCGFTELDMIEWGYEIVCGRVMRRIK